METISLIRKNTIVSLFPIKVKNSKITENFPLREKVEKIPSFSEGRKSLYIINIYYGIFPDGQRGKGRRA